MQQFVIQGVGKYQIACSAEKLKMIEQNETLLEELEESIAYYEMRIEEIQQGTSVEDRMASRDATNGAAGSGYTGKQKIRARNARIRSRYYKN